MDYGGGTIKRQSRAAYGWLVVGQSVGAGLAPTAYRLYASSVCDINSAAAAAVCGLWCYINVICLCLCSFMLLWSDDGWPITRPPRAEAFIGPTLNLLPRNGVCVCAVSSLCPGSFSIHAIVCVPSATLPCRRSNQTDQSLLVVMVPSACVVCGWQRWTFCLFRNNIRRRL